MDSAGSAATSFAPRSSAAGISRSSPSTTSATCRRWRTSCGTTRCSGPFHGEVQVGERLARRRRQGAEGPRRAGSGEPAVGRPRRRRRDRVDRVLHRPGLGAEASRRRREEGDHLGARDRPGRHARARRQRRPVRRRPALDHLERVVHDELRRADGEGARRELRDRARLHDDDPRVHERPAGARPAAQGPAPRARRRDQPDPDLDRRRAGDRARAAAPEGQGRRHLRPRSGRRPARSPTSSSSCARR